MNNSPILIQGAMQIEINYYLSQLEQSKETNVYGVPFYSGLLNGKPAVICKTGVGTINAAIATMVALNTFHPSIIINQGTAGAHVSNLDTYDIVIGESCVNINDLAMPTKSKGNGSNPLEWEFSKRSIYQYADKVLVALFNHATYLSHKKYIGTLGSGDLFSREVDRITWIQTCKGNLCEDMESISVYEICNRFSVPCIGIRIISNNEITLQPYDDSTPQLLQQFIVNTIKDFNYSDKFIQ